MDWAEEEAADGRGNAAQMKCIVYVCSIGDKWCDYNRCDCTRYQLHLFDEATIGHFCHRHNLSAMAVNCFPAHFHSAIVGFISTMQFNGTHKYRLMQAQQTDMNVSFESDRVYVMFDLLYC